MTDPITGQIVCKLGLPGPCDHVVCRTPSNADSGGALSCGCDTTISHECDRHIIERLERELQGLRDRLSDACTLAAQGMTSSNSWAQRLFIKIFDLTKG